MTPIEPIYMEIGDRIRAMRKRSGMTQGCLAKRMRISRPALVNIELGRQRVMIHNLARYAKALNVTPQALLRGIWS